jgi:hypothetical protein
MHVAHLRHFPSGLSDIAFPSLSRQHSTDWTTRKEFLCNPPNKCAAADFCAKPREFPFLAPQRSARRKPFAQQNGRLHNRTGWKREGDAVARMTA